MPAGARRSASTFNFRASDLGCDTRAGVPAIPTIPIRTQIDVTGALSESVKAFVTAQTRSYNAGFIDEDVTITRMFIGLAPDAVAS
jgi:hypothetical protein